MKRLFLGLDGCRAGWVASVFNPDAGFQSIRIIPHLSMLKEERQLYRRIFIDMPIGLPENGAAERECDRLARSYLNKRKTSVFRVPVRKAVYAKSFQKAVELNRHATGKGISCQTWNIADKMREVDSLMTKYGCLKKNVYESHPEVCFTALNHGREMSENKKTSKGQRMRVKVLRYYDAGASRVFSEAMKDYKRLQASADDFLDAMSLSLSASFLPRKLPRVRIYDNKKLPMQIVLPKIE